MGNCIKHLSVFSSAHYFNIEVFKVVYSVKRYTVELVKFLNNVEHKVSKCHFLLYTVLLKLKNCILTNAGLCQCKEVKVMYVNVSVDMSLSHVTTNYCHKVKLLC